MLQAKGVAFERVDLVPVLSRVWLRMTGFPAGTVPALRLDGLRIQGSCAIARAVDSIYPEPPLFPSDPAVRVEVERIEAWGEGPFQQTTRRIALWTASRGGLDLRFVLVGARLQFRAPNGLALRLLGPLLRIDAALAGADEATVRTDLAALPGLLDQIDAWIEGGRLGADPPSAADYQLAGSIWLLLAFDDVAPLIEGRPAAELARRLVVPLPGSIPSGVLPTEWLPAGRLESREADSQLGA